MCTHSGPAPEKPNNDTTHSHKWTHRARSLATTRKARRNTERDFLPRTRRPCKKSWAQGQLQLRAARSARSGSRTAARPASAPRAAPARTTAAARRSPATSKRRRKRRAAGSRQAAKPRHQRQGRAGPVACRWPCAMAREHRAVQTNARSSCRSGGGQLGRTCEDATHTGPGARAKDRRFRADCKRPAQPLGGCVPSDAQSIPEYHNGSDGDVAKCSSIVTEHEKSTRHLPNSRQRPSLGMSLGHAQINKRPACTR